MLEFLPRFNRCFLRLVSTVPVLGLPFVEGDIHEVFTFVSRVLRALICDEPFTWSGAHRCRESC